MAADRSDEGRVQTGQAEQAQGALHGFAALFENPKQARQSDSWRRFFLSEAFLGEQLSEEFGERLLDYLRRQQACPEDNLPTGLLSELAIAYAVDTYLEREEYFPVMGYVAEIFRIQGREYDLESMIRRMLRQPANKARRNAFADYLAVREMSRRGQLTEADGEIWQPILNKCQVHYLYERNGRRPGQGDYESRSECVVKLYVQWLKDERLPECVLKFFYKKLDFKGLDHSSTRGLYGALKEQVLRQLPDVEELLFGESGREQAIVKVYRACAGIISDHQTNYDKSVYEETESIRQRVRELFAMPQWDMLKGDQTFFQRLFFVAKRLVMPPSLTRGLIDYLAAGDFPEPKKTELTESLLRSLSTERSCKEMDCVYEMDPGDRKPGEMDLEEMEQSGDFWQYFLMRGFGFRHEKLRGQWESGYIYEADGECCLPAYIRYIYDPSRAWQRRFVGFDQEREEIDSPVSRRCSMPGGRQLRVEFHYHYCLYFVDEVLVTAPVLTFRELEEYVEERERGGKLSPVEFFFLLAVTAVEECSREAAKELIGTWLGKTPLYPQLCPLVAGLLAADNDRLPGDTRTVCYMEQERFCFRAVAGEHGIRVFRQMEFGWEDINYRQPEFGWSRAELPPALERRAEEFSPETGEDGRDIAMELLEALRQPIPERLGSRTVEGMDMEEKTAVILETMGFSVKDESYCVLRYGEKRERRHDRLFYGAKVPFGFSLGAQSGEHERRADFLMSVCSAKIKEGNRMVARFGWGFKYNHQSDFWPVCVYLGDSGTYYAYGAIRLHRAETLVELLADLLKTEFWGVTEAEVYEGCLSVSRFDHRLECCYREEDWIESIMGSEQGTADMFTVFGRSRLWTEFSRWLDGLCGEELPRWVNVVILGLDPDFGGSLTFRGIHEEKHEESEEDREDFEGDENRGDTKLRGEGPGEDGTGRGRNLRKEDYGVYCPDAPVLVWARGLDLRSRFQELREAVRWHESRKAGSLGERGIRIEVE